MLKHPIAALALLLVFSCAAHGVENTPKKKHVPLEEFTTVTIDMVPDLGTRLVFPFVLDETVKEGVIPFTMHITNPVFNADRQPGRNVIVLTAPPPSGGGDMSGLLGDLFISVAGYNITARLRTVKDWRQQYDDIVFDLTEADRQRLVDDEVARRMKTIDTEYAQKHAALNKEAERMALAKVGYLATQKPRASRVREKANQVLPNGDKISLYVDSVLGYGRFSVIPFDLYADTVGAVKITDARLFGQGARDAPEQEIPVSFNVKRRIESGDRVTGAVAIDDPDIMDMYSLKLVVLTDKGQVDLTW